MRLLHSSEAPKLSERIEAELLQAEASSSASDDQLLIAFWSFDASLSEAIARHRRRWWRFTDSKPSKAAYLVEASYESKALFAARLGAGGCLVRSFTHAGAHFCVSELCLRVRLAGDSPTPLLVRGGVVQQGRAPTWRETWAETAFASTRATDERGADVASLRLLRETLLGSASRRSSA